MPFRTYRNTLAAMFVSVAAISGSSAIAEQFKGEILHPMMVTRTGPFATAATATVAGQQDYFSLLNSKGGIEGYKVVWEECEIEYKPARALECYERHRGNWKLIYPNSTPAIFALQERVTKDEVLAVNTAGGRADSTDGQTFPYLAPVMNNFWAQASSTVRYLATREGGEEKLKGKKIAFIHLDNDYGRQPYPIFDALAKQLGFEWKAWPLTAGALEQSAAWVDIARRYKPDYVVGWLFGQSCNVPFNEMKRTGFPVEKYVGSLWCGSEEDVRPAGDLALGAIAGNYHGVGRDFPVVQEILEAVHKPGRGNIHSDQVGTVAYNRGVLMGVIIAESFRNALRTQGAPLTGKKVRDGFRQVQLTEQRLAELGAKGLMPPLLLSEKNHGGVDPQIFQKWDGTKWTPASEWIAPYNDVVAQQIETSAKAFREQMVRK